MGNEKVYTVLGASNHVPEDRAKHDFYATDPIAAEHLLSLESFSDVWECACGTGHLAKVFRKHGLLSKASDLIDRGYGEQIDFLKHTEPWHGDIITNPPYKYAQEFVEHGINLLLPGCKMALFLKLQFLEGKKRKDMFERYPPKTVYVSSSRIWCAKNARFDEGASSAVAYAWFVWVKGFISTPVIKWFN